jgi:hypothetical protein
MSDDKITVTKIKTKNCESIILNHRWIDIELILDRTY